MTASITFSPAIRADDACANYWLRQVTVRLRREICWLWHERGVYADAAPCKHGESTVLPPYTDKVQSALDMSRFWDAKCHFFQSDPTAGYLTEQLRSQPPCASAALVGSFSWVVNRLALDDVSSFVLALGLAAVFDNAMGSVMASCLNDPAKTQPNLALAQKLWDQPEHVLRVVDPTHPLFRLGLLQLGRQNPSELAEIDWESPLLVPSLVANRLLFPDASLPPRLTVITQRKEATSSATDSTDSIRLVGTRLRAHSAESLNIVPILGPKGSAHVEVVHALSELTQRQVVQFTASPALLENKRYLNSLATLCWLNGLDFFIGSDFISDANHDKNRGVSRLLPALSIPITVFLGITERKQLPKVPSKYFMPIVEVPPFSYHERVRYWKKALGPSRHGYDEMMEEVMEEVIKEGARRFRYQKETIDAICAGLTGSAGAISKEDFIAACRAELELDIGELAQKVTPRFHDEQLILPPKQEQQFEEVISAMKALTKVHYDWGTAKAWSEGGITALFAGSPGTGKTMGAEILAVELDLPMYRIDLSQVVNKYIGETEKNLKRLFDAADISDIILFFDEADSLFGQRTQVKDAHDRHANLEISYLLERMERFKGLAILATNRKKDLDEAFLRRLRYIIDFPLPEAQQRKRIWLQTIPKGVDRSQIDFDFLATQFQLAGGHIRSIVFNACLQSANRSSINPPGFAGQLSMEAVIVAVKREYDKLNRSISLAHFGPYAEIVQKMEAMS